MQSMVKCGVSVFHVQQINYAIESLHCLCKVTY